MYENDAEGASVFDGFLEEVHCERAQVVAPNDGLVTQLRARQGALVQAGQPLAQLVPTQTYLVANFKETQLADMRVGQRATVDVDAYGGREFTGRIQSIAAATGSRGHYRGLAARARGRIR